MGIDLKRSKAIVLTPKQENALIKQLVNNEDAAFEQLVRNYSDKMYQVARRFFNNDADAQDCLQKAFIQVFQHIQSFNQQAKLTTWLHRITVNCALMMLRKQKSHQALSHQLSNELFEEYQQQYNEHGERTMYANNTGQSLESLLANNIEQRYEKLEEKDYIDKLIFQLPEKYCNVLLLRDIQELSTKETANILAISEVAVKTQLHRARLFLKQVLEQQGVFAGSFHVKR
jgi:RNA polymerase sigma-70 factor (ECF subfamily)